MFKLDFDFGNIVHYLVQGLVLTVLLNFIVGNKGMNMRAMMRNAVMVGVALWLMDMFLPMVGLGTRVGAGLAIGRGLVA